MRDGCARVCALFDLWCTLCVWRVDSEATASENCGGRWPVGGWG